MATLKLPVKRAPVTSVLFYLHILFTKGISAFIIFLRNEINLNFDWGTIGLVLGGILLLILIIFVIVFFCSRGACKGKFRN